MNQPRTVRRQFQPTTDAQTRWDRAYQFLLQLSSHEPVDPAPPAGPTAPMGKELAHADRPVCPCLDCQPSTDANH
jgi:hypothetical protein